MLCTYMPGDLAQVSASKQGIQRLSCLSQEQWWPFNSYRVQSTALLYGVMQCPCKQGCQLLDNTGMPCFVFHAVACSSRSAAEGSTDAGFGLQQLTTEMAVQEQQHPRQVPLCWHVTRPAASDCNQLGVGTRLLCSSVAALFLHHAEDLRCVF